MADLFDPHGSRAEWDRPSFFVACQCVAEPPRRQTTKTARLSNLRCRLKGTASGARHSGTPPGKLRLGATVVQVCDGNHAAGSACIREAIIAPGESQDRWK